jgi:hypothetical protein
MRYDITKSQPYGLFVPPVPAVRGVTECQGFYLRVEMRTRLASSVWLAAATLPLITPAAQAHFGKRFAYRSIRTPGGTDIRKEEVN